MSLYDDLDAIKQKSDHVAGWSSGIKLFQSQLQLKKASQTQPRREQVRKSGSVLAPVIDLKSKKDEEDSNSNSSFGSYPKESRNLNFSPHLNAGNTRDLEWNFEGVEYDPMWPNDYEKVVKVNVQDRKEEASEFLMEIQSEDMGNTSAEIECEPELKLDLGLNDAEDPSSSTTLEVPEPKNSPIEYESLSASSSQTVPCDLRKIRDREKEKEEEEKKKRRRRDERAQVRERYNNETNHFDHDNNIMGTPEDRRKNPPTCFAGTGRRESDSDEEDLTERTPRGGGVAIAPPPSLQESSPAPSLDTSPARTSSNPPQYGASVAAKIMAKYGFKEGQGLGKKEQGISMALQVEKTSKRGGRIIHEKDMMPPPLVINTPPRPGQSTSPVPQSDKPEPTITEIMKSPSKVVLLRNMVGPREVDEELEPEVKEECNTKYGDVIRVIIYEIPDVHPEEAVRIFVEFKRIESAIKAVVDLNGRFFGGRQVKAGFYSWQKLNSLQLLD